jgi:hypothetical protein
VSGYRNRLAELLRGNSLWHYRLSARVCPPILLAIGREARKKPRSANIFSQSYNLPLAAPSLADRGPPICTSSGFQRTSKIRQGTSSPQALQELSRRNPQLAVPRRKRDTQLVVHSPLALGLLASSPSGTVARVQFHGVAKKLVSNWRESSNECAYLTAPGHHRHG